MALLPSLGALRGRDAGAPVKHGRRRAVAAGAALAHVAVGVRSRVLAGGSARGRALQVLGSAGTLQAWRTETRRQRGGAKEEEMREVITEVFYSKLHHMHRNLKE